MSLCFCRFSLSRLWCLLNAAVFAWCFFQLVSVSLGKSIQVDHITHNKKLRMHVWARQYYVKAAVYTHMLYVVHLSSSIDTCIYIHLSYMCMACSIDFFISELWGPHITHNYTQCTKVSRHNIRSSLLKTQYFISCNTKEHLRT